MSPCEWMSWLRGLINAAAGTVAARGVSLHNGYSRELSDHTSQMTILLRISTSGEQRIQFISYSKYQIGSFLSFVGVLL